MNVATAAVLTAAGNRYPLWWIGSVFYAILLLDALSESLELGCVYVDEPLEVHAHLPLRLVDLLEVIEVLSEDAHNLMENAASWMIFEAIMKAK